jgi:hypothetical protein
MTIETHLPAGQLATIRSGLRRGQYSLLLGAGFSIDSQDTSGKPLPTGLALAKEIADRFRLPSKYSLSSLCGAIPQKDLREYLGNRFSNCHASPSARLISSFLWKSIYTLNIDDVLHDIYRPGQALQEAQFLTHRNGFSRPNESGVVQVVHLHGSVRQVDHGFVFSPAEYGAAAAGDSVWFKIATDELLSTPFIVVGLALDEPDFEYYLARRNGMHTTTGAVVPSIYVNPDLDDVLISRCARFGLTPVQMTAGEFWSALDRFAGDERSVWGALAPTDPVVTCRASERSRRVFLRQWLRVDSRDMPEPVWYAPLISGVEPCWRHIKGGEVVLRADMRLLVEDIARWRTSPTTHVRVVRGEVGDGKSCALLRTANDAATTLGLRVYYFVGQERLDPGAAASVLGSLAGPSLVVVDSAADHAFQIAEFVATARVDNVPVYVLCGERTVRTEVLHDALLDEPIAVKTLDSLSGDEAATFVDRLRQAGRLGFNAGFTGAQLASRLTGMRLLEGLLSVGNIEPLARRLATEFDELGEAERRVYLAVALAHASDYELRIPIAERASEVGMARLTEMLESTLRGCVVVPPLRPAALTTRHRVVAENLCRQLPYEAKFDGLIRLTRALAPYVNRGTIKQRLPEARLAGRLMDFENVESSVGRNLTLKFYDQVLAEWTWNSRYWEQRALAHLNSDDLENALAYAEHAVGIERHPLPFTTLARVRFGVAHGRHYARFEDRQLVIHGIGAIEEAVELSHRFRRREIHPYDVLVNGVVAFVEWCAEHIVDLRTWEGWDRVNAMLLDGKAQVGASRMQYLVDRWERSKAHFGLKL